MRFLLKQHSIIPGFNLTLGVTVTYLSLVVLLPLAALVAKTTSLSWAEFWAITTSPRILAACKLSFGCAAAAATVNVFFGAMVAWVLVRYRFPGRKLVDALIDLPFALPTAVAGIALTAVYCKTGWIGQVLEPMGIQVAFAPLGIMVALTFIGLPFVVRTVQPLIEDLDPQVEEAAASLGASRLRTLRQVILPELWPALLTGFAMALARGLGEYGSIVFISGNKPMKTEIAPLMIMMKLEEYDYAGATAIAVLILAISFVLLLAINLLQRYSGQQRAARMA